MEEISDLKNKLNKNDNIESINNMYEQKVNELEQYKEINEKLQERVLYLHNELEKNKSNNESSEDDIKINKLNEIKILEENINNIIIKNIENFSNTEEFFILSYNNYKFISTIKNIISIELFDFDLPFAKYNITINNNNLKIKINNIESYNTETLNDIESFIDFNIDDDILDINIITGNYDINTLIEEINKYLHIFKIEIICNNTTKYISFKKIDKNLFSLIFTDNSLLCNLGFNSTLNKHINKLKITGSKPYDLNIDKIMNIYLYNIGNKPIMQYYINQNNNPKEILFNPKINELNELNIKFIDSKNKEFKFNDDLDFNIKIKIKSINNKSYFNNTDNIIDIIKNDIC